MVLETYAWKIYSGVYCFFFKTTPACHFVQQKQICHTRGIKSPMIAIIKHLAIVNRIPVNDPKLTYGKSIFYGDQYKSSQYSTMLLKFMSINYHFVDLFMTNVSGGRCRGVVWGLSNGVALWYMNERATFYVKTKSNEPFSVNHFYFKRTVKQFFIHYQYEHYYLNFAE